MMLRSPKGFFVQIRPRTPVHWFAIAAALLLTAAAYLQSAVFEFAYDDYGQIVYNPRVQSWKLVWSNFTSHVWAHTGDLALYYRPVFMLWLAANYALFGLHPLFWHLTTVGLHLAACGLFYVFARRLTENQWTAVIATLLFGLHPAHVEAVAWISGATESLLAVLLFGSLLCYLRHRDSGKRGMTGSLAGSLVLAFLAALTKESALVLPGLIFSYEWAFYRASPSWKDRLRSAVRAMLPYVPVSAAYLVVRALVLKSAVPEQNMAGYRAVLLAWPEAIAFYIGHVLFPVHLSVFYKPLLVFHPGWQNFVLPLMAVAAGAGALYYGSRRSRVFAFLSLWCITLLVPMLNVTLWNNLENVHDRYLYLPSAAYCLILAMLLSRLKDLHHTRTVAAVLVLIAGGYIYVTEREMRYFRNDYELAHHGVALSPDHPIALQLLGNSFIRQGRVAEAVPWLVDGIGVDPKNVQTLLSLGFCYSEMDNLLLAEESITRAIALKGSEPRAHLLLGMVRLKQNRLTEAEAEIRLGLRLQRQLLSEGETLYHYYLGNVLYAKGDVQGAVGEYLLETRNNPANDPAVATAQARLEEIYKRDSMPVPQH